MNRICRYAFPGAKRVIDRFHVQKQVLEAVQEVRIAHRWDAINADTEAREQVNLTGEKYEPARLANGDTPKELLARGRYALFKSPEKWTDSQRQRVDLMFSLYPDRKKPTGCHNISVQYSPTRSQWPTMPDSIWLCWYNRVAESGFKSFNTIAATFYEHSDEIINYFDNRSTNASAESINSKIKVFRAKFHWGQRYQILHLPPMQPLCLNTAFYYAPFFTIRPHLLQTPSKQTKRKESHFRNSLSVSVVPLGLEPRTP